MGHYDAKTGSKSQGIASEALQVQAPAGSPDASGETLDTTPGSIMSFTRALPGEKALARLALQVKKSGVSRENHTPPACLTPTILSSLAASIPGPTAHLVEILQVGGEMNVPGAGRVSPEQERKLASIALNIPSTLHLSSRKLTAEAAGDLARAFTTPRPEKIIGTLARISQDLLREKIVSDSDRKALLEWVANTVDGIPGRTDQQDCSAYLMWNIAHIGLNAGCTAKAMESFLDLLASQSSGALGGILAGKAIEFDTSISDEDERCLVQLRVFQAIGHNQNKLFTWLETNLACNAEFQGHQAGMTAHRSLEYFKPLLEILAHPPSNPPAATIARAVLDGTAHWTDLDHIMNAQWGTFCENVKGSFCTPQGSVKVARAGG
jgi:hypothetical protein